MNRLWRTAHRLMSGKGGVSQKIGRIIELANHILCGCSVSAKAQIGKGTIFFHRGIGCVIHPNAKIGDIFKMLR